MKPLYERNGCEEMNHDYQKEEQGPEEAGERTMEENETVPFIVTPIPLSPNKGMNRSSSYGSFNECVVRTVRFQVVVWYVGPVDAVHNQVTMKFRVTIYWNAPTGREHDAMSRAGYGTYDAFNKRVWTMHGRQRAYQRELTEIIQDSRLVYVPPVSIVNAVDFETVGEPEICLVNEQKQCMKWTCMYSAGLIQEDMCVSQFPHDAHNLVLKLGIMRHRQAGMRWDRRKWRIGLATEKDSEKTIRTPHGLVVDHVSIPEFLYDRNRGLIFDVSPFRFGSDHCEDECLTVTLPVKRESGYYDKNIIPLLAMMNLVGVATLVLEANEFGSRGEILLAVAFVEIGIRMTVDNKLPAVGYQIKIQRLLNQFFYLILFLFLESSLIYTMQVRLDCHPAATGLINLFTIFLALVYNTLLLGNYYWGWGETKLRFLRTATNKKRRDSIFRKKR